ncbi:MAG: hypothetical protein ACRCXD_10315 [Luteolibacter sp.]
MAEPDSELKAWVEALLDQRIDPADARRLSDRLRDDAAARKYCAGMLRFDAAMQDELCPQEIEWTDTRKVTLTQREGGPGLEVQRNQSVRFGPGGGDWVVPASAPQRVRWLRWAVGLLGVALLACGLIVWTGDSPAPAAQAPALLLLNPDFEATDLTFLPEPTNRALVDWQDYFVTENAEVAEISRSTQGAVLPKSGRNVARLSNYAYLTQRLRRADSSRLLARPGLTVAVSGWAYVLDDPTPNDSVPDPGASESPEPFALRAALRFVAGGSPGMVQYEAAGAVTSLVKGDWQPFRIELSLPNNLTLPASHGVAQTKLDLTGKELTLSLDSLCVHGYQLLLDDLAIEEIR